MPADPCRERVDGRLKVFFGQVCGTRVDVHHTEPRLYLDLGGQVRMPATHVHLAGDAGLREEATNSRTYTFIPPLSPEPG